ncbi:MAG: 4a-hydroxytetrahydrobiopterin dehydratase [Bacillota bacterium]|nr:4a-hydroxytetrahydrobiopterin dehydratase [Bacillota bacterium]
MAVSPEHLKDLPGWEIREGTLAKTFHFPSFLDAMEFVGRVAELAEKQKHHPDILIQYKVVTLRLSTHDAGAITEKDLQLAREIQSLPAARG